MFSHNQQKLMLVKNLKNSLISSLSTSAVFCHKDDAISGNLWIQTGNRLLSVEKRSKRRKKRKIQGDHRWTLWQKDNRVTYRGRYNLESDTTSSAISALANLMQHIKINHTAVYFITTNIRYVLSVPLETTKIIKRYWKQFVWGSKRLIEKDAKM